MLKSTIAILLLLFLFGCNNDLNSIYTSSSPTNSSNNPSGSNLLVNSPTTDSSIPMLAILLSYNNIQISSNETTWAEKLYGENQSQLNHYFLQNSTNKFKFTPAKENSGITDNGVALVKLNKNHPDTNIDNSNFSQNVYPDFTAALKSLNNTVDFSNFDKDANGVITSNELLLVFIVAGYEDSYENRHVVNGIWAHQNCMIKSENIPILDSVSLLSCKNKGRFLTIGELHDKSFSHDATIGIIAHELGHLAFGLPDLYNTKSPQLGGIGYLGLMGSGTWGQKSLYDLPGNTPTHLSAWSKSFIGWSTPLETNGTVALYETASNRYNTIKIPINETSYYLLENRNNSGYDRGLFSLSGDFNGGIAIWKIDNTRLTEKYFSTNSVNSDVFNSAVVLIKAIPGSQDKEESLFYESNTNSFSNIVKDISQRGSIMSFTIKN